MMFYSLREAIDSLRGHKLQTAGAMLTIALLLMIFGVFLIIFQNIAGLRDRLQDRFAVIVYLNDGLSPEQVSRIEREIRSYPEVQSVVYISKEDALSEFQRYLARHAQVLEGLGSNPLPASLTIGVRGQYQSPQAVGALAERLRTIAGVEEVEDRLDWLDVFSSISGIAGNLGIGVGVFLGLAVVAITANTIRMSVYARRQEISLIRLIGAKEGFVRAPFFIEGAMIGLSAGLLAVAALWLVFTLFQKRVFANPGVLWQNLTMGFLSPDWLIGLLVSATVLSAIGGYVSVEKVRVSSVRSA